MDLRRQGKELQKDPNQGSHQCFPAWCQADQMWHPWLFPCVFPVPADAVVSFPFSLKRQRWVWIRVGLESGEQGPSAAVAEVSTAGETKTLDLNCFGRGLWHRSHFPVPGLSEIGHAQHSHQYLFPRTLFSPYSVFNTNFIQILPRPGLGKMFAIRIDFFSDVFSFSPSQKKIWFALTLAIVKYI